MKTTTIGEMQITPDEDWHEFTVVSPSGNSYTVTYCGSGDADPDYVSLWECDCPAAKYRSETMCKHSNAVAALCDESWPPPRTRRVRWT